MKIFFALRLYSGLENSIINKKPPSNLLGFGNEKASNKIAEFLSAFK
jgi:hypothetical protein